jgi:AbrB family looped-hinge helix DNA binding protein
MNSVVSGKGQVTIPKRLRDQLGLRVGTALQFRIRRGALFATKAVERDVFSKWRGRGVLPCGASVDEYLRVSRSGA